MSKSTKKRLARDSPQSENGDSDSMLKFEHESLVQHYLTLQKEFVAKKKKLQIVKQKRDTLLDDIRFLRRRHRYLMEMQTNDVQKERGLVPPQDLSMHCEVVEEPLRVEDKPKSCLTKGKSLEKKKISWRDQLGLKVQESCILSAKETS
ncbi:hypothetical protein K2173_023180 [Erythroxylum novogranatense]|uniref:Uncharacterized protein n=1 Tax=Erythroxylum novogranatense TaxID=1862640 RepID=A0AAV8UAM8_9ROSI|nr:hypothetical protein K2173_023180 [Erythroxylum novogranatense]